METRAGVAGSCGAYRLVERFAVGHGDQRPTRSRSLLIITFIFRGLFSSYKIIEVEATEFGNENLADGVVHDEVFHHGTESKKHVNQHCLTAYALMKQIGRTNP